MKTTYRHHEAGFHAETDVPTINKSATVADALLLLKTQSTEFSTINYVYIVSENRVLAGVVSVRELFQANSITPLAQFCTKKLIVARPHTDQERVARLALHHGIKAVPVVSASHEFIGAVPSDTILSILDAEHHEDMLRTSGISLIGHQYVSTSPGVWQSITARLPWLIVGLGGGGVAAAVVAYFETSIAAIVLLAAFIPAVVYLADAVWITDSVGIDTCVGSHTRYFICTVFTEGNHYHLRYCSCTRWSSGKWSMVGLG
jgi:magnesium transporter